MMDDMRVYDRAINQDEVALIYAGDLEQNVTMGGEDPVITLFWGDEDAGQTTDLNASSPDAWDASNLLGVMPTGEFFLPSCRAPSRQNLLLPLHGHQFSRFELVANGRDFLNRFFRIYGRLVCWRKFTSLVGRDGYQWRR